MLVITLGFASQEEQLLYCVPVSFHALPQRTCSAKRLFKLMTFPCFCPESIAPEGVRAS